MENASQEDADAQLIDIVCKTSGSAYFDEAVGHIEDIVLSETFLILHNKFLEKYWHNFENTDENKLECMEIFEEYTNTFETFFMKELQQRMTNFDMERFANELEAHNAFLDTANYGEIYELLHSFTDFQIFKELMLDYRAKKEGDMEHLNVNILTTTPIYTEVVKGVATDAETEQLELW